ncbi:DUF2254 domain-containing protein [Chelativorans sp. YIM 93263]|uniref:DUF2254 domain-containing protein n=1 Tax=Chelativorans sp. YIM 93263 TaxID=2906648 RepID=UPI002378D71B|nr:DUF2254 domain-containing protein [Chelativorans sp. YIM 93263]
MIARFRTLWESVSTSLWFVPGLMVFGAVLLAWSASSIDVDTGGTATRWLHSGSAEDASTLLSALLPAMISMATLVISITMVVLVLAAGQLGPRLIRNFMASVPTQLMLGFFLATVFYLILVLRLLNDGRQDGGAPHLAITIATALVLVCVILLLLFVHHLARSIVSDTVIERVGRDLDAAILGLLPEAKVDSLQHERPPLQGGINLSLPNGGYVQAIDYKGLVSCARKAGAVIDLGFRPGQFLLAQGDHGRVHDVSALDEEMLDNISEYVVIGNQRTATQDVEFAVRQLVEVALRALSPGINDPFTAVAAIDRLALSLALVMRRGRAQTAWSDEDGTIRVTGKVTTFDGIVDAAFNQIRQSTTQPAVLIRLMTALVLLAEQVRREEHREALLRHVELVLAAGSRSIEDAVDLDALKKRGALARARLEM